LTEGYGSTGGQDYPAQTMTLLGQPLIQYLNLGIGGQTISSMIANAPARVDPRFANRNAEKWTVVFWGGANDLNTGSNAATIYSKIKTYCQARKNAGEHVLFMSMLPFGFDAAKETIRADVNTLLRADFATPTAFMRIYSGAAWADYMLDIGADPTIGVAGSQSNTTYYLVDGVHLTNAAYGVVAGYAKDGLSFIFP
jgi:lysophospholipase L1-like esterase